MTDVHQVAIPHALREYAFVADGERGALIGPQGHYAWMCFPVLGLTGRVHQPARRARRLSDRPGR